MIAVQCQSSVRKTDHRIDSTVLSKYSEGHIYLCDLRRHPMDNTVLTISSTVVEILSIMLQVILRFKASK